MALNIIDNKLLQLASETIPLTAISSISVQREPARKSRIVWGGIILVLFVAITLEAIFGTSVSGLTPGHSIITIPFILVGLRLIASGLQTVNRPKYFLMINLHGARATQLDIGSEEQALQAEKELQTAMLGVPPAPVLAAGKNDLVIECK